MATLTLQDIRALAAHAAGGLVISDGKRHTPTVVNALINAELEKYHLALTDRGHPQRITRTTVTTSATTTVTLGWPLNEYVTLPADFLALRSMHLIEGEERMLMSPFTEPDRDTWEGPSPARPELFQLAETTTGTKIARIWPAADAAYTLEVTYIPTATTLDEDGDEFTFFPGTQDLVVCSVAMQMLEADGVQEQAQYQALAGRAARAGQILTEFAPRQNRAGPRVMKDVGSLRTRNRLMRDWRSWGT